MTKKLINICFFRNVLRVHDNQSIFKALQQKDAHLLPVAVVDPRMVDISSLSKELDQDFKAPKTWFFKLTRASCFRLRFYYESISALKKELENRGTDLVVLFGEPETLFPQLKKHIEDNGFKFGKIYTHKEYAYEEVRVEEALSKAMNGDVVYSHDTMLVNPEDLDFVKERTYKVYTHFRKRIEKMENPVRDVLPIPEQLPPFPEIAWKFDHASKGHEYIQKLNKEISFKKDSRSAVPWEGGEKSAIDRLNSYVFKTNGVADYKHTRNGMIGTEFSTKFSIFLSHGCLSPRLIWQQIEKFDSQAGNKRKKPGSDDDGVYWVKFELLWRDFFRLLVIGYGKTVFMLHGFRDMTPKEETVPKSTDEAPRKNSYADKVWKSNDEQFEKWKNGQTGTPFVDACMRELLYTGFLNNRGRQNVASYFSKDLEIDWRLGAEYFEYILTDHDVHSNYGNWQYVAGVGCDPREGFRHFNIMKQAKDYDPDGDYVRLWCPELENVPKEFVHCPWLMSAEDQKRYKCELGRDYPKPMIIFDSWKRHYPAGATNGNIASYFNSDQKKGKKKVKA